MIHSTYPHVRTKGGPCERGRSYGEQAREHVGRSIEAYAPVFEYYAGLSWQEARDEAHRFAEPIADYQPSYLEELRGIAEGASVELDDLLALNLRSEIIDAGNCMRARRQARTTEATAAAAHPKVVVEFGKGGGQCSSLVALPDVTLSGHTLIGQNWDWLTHARHTTIVLEAEQDDGPNYVTVVEAGLLAKTGMNAAGLGLVTNSVTSDRDSGSLGLPYHVCLRSLLDAGTMTDAVARLQKASRASSANYLLGHADGLAINVEATPGDFSRLSFDAPRDGVFTHTNHFISRSFEGIDIGLSQVPDSLFRLQRLTEAVRRLGSAITPEGLQGAFADHANYPLGVCTHPKEGAAAVERWATIASLVMDLDTRRLWLADGNPCETSYRELDYSGFLGSDA